MIYVLFEVVVAKFLSSLGQCNDWPADNQAGFDIVAHTHAVTAGPTWSSTSSEGCVAAIEQACNKICSRLQPHLQQKSSAWETWQATVAEVQEGSGLSPASVMLSAYGFYDGTERDAQGRTTKGGLD